MNWSRSIRILMWIALASLVLIPGAFSRAQTSSWTQPEVIESEFGWWPSLALDPLGGVHVVWSAGQQRDHDFPVDVLMYRYKGPGGWSVGRDVLASNDYGFTVRNGITVTADGMVHAVFRSRNSILYTEAAIGDAAFPQGWTSPRLVSTGTAYYTDLAASPRGTLHLVFSSATSLRSEFGNLPECPACSEVQYRRSDDGGQTWSAIKFISKTQWGSEKPRLWVDNENDIYVTWDEGIDFIIGVGQLQGVSLVASHDGGKTWEEPVTFGPMEIGEESLFPQEVTFGKDGNGNLVVVYHLVFDTIHRSRDRAVYYQVSDDEGKTWTEPQAIPGVFARPGPNTGLDDYDMARDSQGNLHLALVGTLTEDEEGSSVIHLEWDGESWGTAEVVYQSENYNEWPRIRVDAGDGLHMVWHDRRSDEIYAGGAGSTLQVFYAERPGRPLPEATLAPTATPPPTATPLLLPTPIRNTPIATAVPWDGTSVGRSTVDEAAASVVLVAVVPVLVLIAAVLLLWGFRIRR